MLRFVAMLGLAILLCGCQSARTGSGEFVLEPEACENPIFVQGVQRDFLWQQVVDAVDDEFKIASEDPVRLVGDYLTEGRLETYPRVGSTLLEPWHRDSTAGYEKLHSTLQTIRRRVSVRVTPTEGGYFIGIVAAKELEDVDRPERGRLGTNVRRHDGTIVRDEQRIDDRPLTLGWIPIGRDRSLEQKLLVDIKARLTDQRVH